MKYSITIGVLFLFFSSCVTESSTKVTETENSKLFQVSVIDALLQGVYDGNFSIEELKNYGRYGIGTFNGLDGEMVVFNDTVFQVKSSGEVFTPDLSTLTPFAAVANMNSDTLFHLENITFSNLKEDLGRYFPTENLFYIIKLHGEFSYMKTRSVPKQEKPYPALVEITKNQPEFEFENVTGDIIGFYSPEFAKGINVTGMHLHFLNQKRTSGGHILAFNLKQGTMEIGYLKNYELLLPGQGEFFNSDFSKDRSEELEKAEQ